MKAPSSQKELLDEGNYIATIYRIIYIGTVKGEWMGTPTESFKVDITWELNDEMKVWKEGEEAKPVVLSKQYTLSMGSKASLRPIVEGVVGGMTDAEAANFDIDELLGKTCLLSITHVKKDDKTYVNVQTSKLMKSMIPPTPFNQQKILSYQDWDDNFYQSLPDWLKGKMAETPEYQTMKGTYKSKFEMPVVNVGEVDKGEEYDLSKVPF